MPSKSFFEAASDVLRDAQRRKIVDPRPWSMQRWIGFHRNVYARMMDTVVEQFKTQIDPSHFTYRQSSVQLPTARRFLQNEQPSDFPLTQPVPGSAWMVELARFPVANGSIGIVKSFEQYAAQGETVYTVTQNWGNPFVLPDRIEWFLRLSPIRELGGAWISVQGPAAIVDNLPGAPFDDLPRLPALWYPAASTPAGNIHLPIPGDNFLRVFALVPASQAAYSLACRLTGTRQVETTPEAQQVVRTSW